MKNNRTHPIIPRRLREITTGSAIGRQVFLELGRKPPLKYAREISAKTAQRLNVFSKLFQRAGIPVQGVIKREGEWLLQNFIPGKSLKELFKDRPVPPKILDEVALQLARMHNITARPLVANAFPKPTVPKLKEEILTKLSALSAKKILEKDEEAEISKFLIGRMPQNPSVVVGHNDVHSGNILLHQGRVFFIDLANLGFEFRDLDLSRTLNYLRLNKKQTARFFRVYKKNGGDISGYAANAGFWDALGRVRQLSSRVQRGLPAGMVSRIKLQLLKIVRQTGSSKK